MKRELRQGDPLAPFLFLIVAEGLAGLMRETVRKGLYEGVRVGLEWVGINLLQFADVTLFFCQPTYQNILVIKVILRCFEITSGLKVNFHKTHVGAIEVNDQDLSIFSKCLNCRQMVVQFRYLCMVIGGNSRRISFWMLIIEKIKLRLSSWKGRFLSLAGRVCLIKAVFTTLPLYYLSFFKAPSSVCKTIKRIQAKFLWGWGHYGRKIAWVSWDTVCNPVEAGGLGIN